MAVVVVVAIPALSAVPSWAAAPHGTPWHPTALHASPAPSTTQNPSVLSLLLFPWQWGFGGGGGGWGSAAPIAAPPPVPSPTKEAEVLLEQLHTARLTPQPQELLLGGGNTSIGVH